MARPLQVTVTRFLVGVSIAAAIPTAIIGWVNWLPRTVPQVQLELFKGLLQFLAVGVAGSAIAMLLRSIERDRQNAEDEREAKREAEERQREADRAAEASRLAEARDRRAADLERIRSLCYDILDTYNTIKIVRRTLRAEIAQSSRDSHDHIAVPQAAYDRLFQQLETAQLGLERLKKLVKFNQSTFKAVGGTESYFDKLERAEQYIRDVLREYEQGQHPLSDGFRRIGTPSMAMGFIVSAQDQERLGLPTSAKQLFFEPMNALEDEAARQLAEL